MLKLLLFLLFPALELYLLVKVGSIIGAFNMVLWVFVSALLGIAAVRSQKQYSFEQMRADMAQGRGPQDSIREGLLLFLGGLLLILPGLITDAIGLILLLPPARRLIGDQLARYAARHASSGAGNTRFIFFGGSPGFRPGGPQDPGFPGPDRNFPHAAPEETGPREAVIIESTAIEITTESKDIADAGSAEKKD